MSEKFFQVNAKAFADACDMLGKAFLNMANPNTDIATVKYKVGSKAVEDLFDKYDYDEIQKIVAKSKPVACGVLR